MSQTVIEISIIALLILLNGFFSMSEMALIASKRVRLQNMAKANVRGANTALRLLEYPDNFFSTIQIGITAIGLLTGVFSGAYLTQTLGAWFLENQWFGTYYSAVALATVVVPVTFATLIVGELVPKRLAYAYSERIATFTAPAMYMLMRLALPMVVLLSFTTRMIMKLFALDKNDAPPVTMEDIKGILGEGENAGVLESAELEMLHRVLRLDDRPLRSLMTHRSDVTWLNLDAPHEELLETIFSGPHSCLPVARGDLTETIGMLVVRRFLAAYCKNPQVRIEAYLDAPIFVNATLDGLALLEQFKSTPKPHVALVVDEYGDVQGMVTLDDAVAAILGQLPDAHGEEPYFVQTDDNIWLIDGQAPLEDVLEHLAIAAPPTAERKGFLSLAAFCLQEMGGVPSIGESFVWQGWEFQIVDMDRHRIDRVRLTPPADAKKPAIKDL